MKRKSESGRTLKWIFRIPEMREVEVKARVSDIKKIKEKLKKLGCKFSEPMIQKDRIYLHESIQFHEISNGTVVLRIRDSNGKITLTSKIPLENELDCIEKELSINDGETMNDILEEIGFREVVKVVKKRIKCRHAGLEICIDEVDNLGQFIEVEKLND